jgi:DNA-binding transcriptional ArsR family regulator
VTTNPTPSAALEALADPMRRQIFERLAAEPRPVGELARELPVTRPAVSQHLRVLKDAGLVVDRAEGTRRIYHVEPAAVEALRGYFDSFWSQALDTFRTTAEEVHDDR